MPFVLITLLYGIVTYLLYVKINMSFEDNLMRFLLIIDVLVVGTSVFTFFIKISVHSLAMAGVVGILMVLNTIVEDTSAVVPFAVSLLVLGIVMSARLYLQVHTLRESFLGALAGGIIGAGGMIVLF